MVRYRDPEGMIAWAELRGGCRYREDAQAIGAEDGSGALRAVVVYDTFGPRDCQVHIVSDGSERWLSRNFARHVATYPFVTCALHRVTAMIAASNAPALALAEGVGFRREGVLREAAADGDDIVALGLLRRDCRWVPKVMLARPLMSGHRAWKTAPPAL